MKKTKITLEEAHDLLTSDEARLLYDATLKDIIFGINSDIIGDDIITGEHMADKLEFLKKIEEVEENNKHVFKTLIGVLKPSENIKAFMLNINPNFDMLIIDAKDISLEVSPLFGNATCIRIEDVLELQDGRKSNHYYCVLVFGRANKLYEIPVMEKHFVKHELLHALIYYFDKLYPDKLLTTLDIDEEEFLADYLPIKFMDEDKDGYSINAFLSFIKDYKTEKMIKKYHKFIKKLVLHLNGNY